MYYNYTNFSSDLSSDLTLSYPMLPVYVPIAIT